VCPPQDPNSTLLPPPTPFRASSSGAVALFSSHFPDPTHASDASDACDGTEEGWGGREGGKETVVCLSAGGVQWELRGWWEREERCIDRYWRVGFRRSWTGCRGWGLLKRVRAVRVGWRASCTAPSPRGFICNSERANVGKLTDPFQMTDRS